MIAALAILSSLAPSAARDTAGIIEVRGCDYAIIAPAAEVITGTDVSSWMGWADEGVVRWRVDRLTEYTITAVWWDEALPVERTTDDATDRPRHTAQWVFPVTRACRIEHAASLLLDANAIIRGEGATFFDITTATQRVLSETP